MKGHSELLDAATTVLADNDRGDFTVPAEPLYPHQWLWDSVFISIGLRHIDSSRAQREILRLLEAQWVNGMVPHVVHNTHHKSQDERVWRSWMNPNAPEHVSTSGITQPPLLAEAVMRIADTLSSTERKSWLSLTYPHLVRYHSWLYTERDPHNEGLTIQIHPWETGLDNTPPWMKELHEHQLPLWIQAVRSLRLSGLFNMFRYDTKIISDRERMQTIDALALYSVQRRLRRKNYDIKRILAHSLFAIEDVSFNAIFIRNNQILRNIAKELKQPLDSELTDNMQRTEKAFEDLWDPYVGQYYSREFVGHRLIKESSIATLIALYSGIVPKSNAEQIVSLLENEQYFGSPYPVASAPQNSDWFDEKRYWQGPSWANTNWLIIDGLQRAGYTEHANALRETTLEMIQKQGFFEYFSPLDGSPAGAERFSWTAAVAIDLALTDKNT